MGAKEACCACGGGLSGHPIPGYDVVEPTFHLAPADAAIYAAKCDHVSASVQPYGCGNFTTHGNFRAVTCQFGYNATTYPPEYMYRARVPTMEQQDQWNYTLAEMDVPFRDFNGTRLPHHLRLVSPTSEMWSGMRRGYMVQCDAGRWLPRGIQCAPAWCGDFPPLRTGMP
jgi:hypothetical protein